LHARAGDVDRAVDVVGPDRWGVRLQPIGDHRRATKQSTKTSELVGTTSTHR
jgi:hypothetical protein